MVEENLITPVWGGSWKKHRLEEAGSRRASGMWPKDPEVQPVQKPALRLTFPQSRGPLCHVTWRKDHPGSPQSPVSSSWEPGAVGKRQLPTSQICPRPLRSEAPLASLGHVETNDPSFCRIRGTELKLASSRGSFSEF